MAVLEETAELEETSKPAAAFDPRTDVSADARFIVRQLTWNLILGFLVLYVTLGVLAWVISQLAKDVNRMKSMLLPLLLIPCLAAQTFAMKSRHETYPRTCEEVWRAAVAVAKSDQYRIVSISSEEQVVSLIAGGVWWGERIISLSLAPGDEGGCTAKVQSRYSGLQHSDGPDLLMRIHVRLIGEEFGTESKAFQEFKSCAEKPYSGRDFGGSHGKWEDEPKCEAEFRHKLASQKPDPAPLWNMK